MATSLTAPMRIIYFTRSYTPHDLRFMARIAERHELFYMRLEDNGIDIQCGSIPSSVRLVEWAGCKETCNQPEQLLGLMPEFEKAVSNVRPDLIHAGPIQSCAFMTALSGFQPFLAMSWGSDILFNASCNPLWNWISRYTLRQCGMLACDCEAVADRARELASGRNLPTVQFPWGIDLDRFTPGHAHDADRSLDGWQDAFVVYSSRSWSEGYGIDTLIEAFARAYRQQPRLRMILVGGGPLESLVHRLIQQYDIASAVSLPGKMANAELVNLLCAADIYISCASSDGSSISMLEAMAIGLPVVVTDIASNREWVVPSVHGWLCADKDPQAFANALLEAASLKSEEREQMGRANRKLAEARADWASNSLKLFQAYDALMARAPLGKP